MKEIKSLFDAAVLAEGAAYQIQEGLDTMSLLCESIEEETAHEGKAYALCFQARATLYLGAFNVVWRDIKAAADELKAGSEQLIAAARAEKG